MLPRDLQHPNVGDARSRSYGAQALAAPNGLADSTAPYLLGSGTPRGGAAYAGQGVHP